MTELSFLIDLLLNHKLPPATKKHVLERVKEVEANYQAPKQTPPRLQPGQQCASTQALLDRMTEPLTAPPLEAIVASPQAAQAINTRQQAIAAQISGKPEPGRTSPRKF